jgi:hypothetical protein
MQPRHFDQPSVQPALDTPVLHVPNFTRHMLNTYKRCVLHVSCDKEKKKSEHQEKLHIDAKVKKKSFYTRSYVCLVNGV